MSEGWGRGGKGRGEGGGGRDSSLTLCISVRWGRGKEVMGNFLGYDLLWCTMFSFEKGSSALKKKSSYPHISHQFSLPSVASLCGLAQQGSTGYFLVRTPINPEGPTPRFQRTSKKI